MIIALNHKSNLDKKEYSEYIEKISKLDSKHQCIMCPSFIHISEEHPENLLIGSQNVSAYENGAHTGEVSAQQLKSYNVKYSLVGHSERRLEQAESLAQINCKIKQLLSNDIIPILCVGESQDQRAKNQIKEVLENEIETATKDLTSEEKTKIIVAYEPIWSIGTGLIPSNKEIKKSVNIIKQLLPDTKILYGGSINEENIDIIKEISDLDGYLIGGLSLKVENLQILLEKLK